MRKSRLERNIKGFKSNCHFRNFRPQASGMTNGGFTLIELLVVVLIIGILAAVALPQYQKAVLKTRYVQIQILGRALQDAVNVYYLTHGVYPTTLEELDIQIPGRTLSTNKQIVTAANNMYSCYLDVRDNSLDSVWCRLETKGTLSYRVVYSGVYKGNRYCVATSSQNEEVCRSVGGINPYDNGVGLMHYKLP